MALMDEYLKDEEYHRLYNQERVILKVTEALCQYMEDHNITRVELARRLDKNKSFISQVLNGGRNLTLRT
ncbi:MAG: helix-turn-helix transcriptional regulator, partial [Deltaproteobacteria bacterium]|nr:helix-turn-helix transcriptional regulator [Deltaproteobacteria bacterium]